MDHIAYINEPEADETLTVKQFKWLLDKHSIPHKYIGNELMMGVEWMKDGEFGTDWIKPKMIYGALMDWLGY